MSENKRFTELTSSIDYYTIWDNNEYKGLTVEDAVDLLNELNDENEQLKSEIKDLNDVLARYEEKELEE